MIRRFKLTLFALFCFMAAGQFIGTGAYSQDPPAEKFFKNIQALKGIPAGRIAGLMDGYNKALGVSCEYCHVAGDITKGDKPAHKVSVREIMMTREINEKYKRTIDCMSCHQGKAKPSGAIGAALPDVKPPDRVNETKGDDKGKMTFTASAGKVFFPHDTHQSMDCSKCHHAGGNSSCSKCHKHNAGDAGLSFKKVSHSPTNTRGCTGCHKQMSVGPQTCTTCHKPEEVPGGTKSQAGPSKLTFSASYGKVPFPHDTHMNMDCAKCHHTGATSSCATCHKHNAGDAGLSFKKVGHSTKARGCAGCHIQSSAGPTKCVACHKK